jgi:hypothetical protein
MKNFLVVFSVVALTLAVWAETPVSGMVDGKWTKEGSPYRVTGDLTVAKATTLWIEPGVEVIFAGPYTLTVEGRLAAGVQKGIHLRMKANPPVKFTTDLSANAAGWGGIKFVKAGDENEIVNGIIEHVRATGDGGGIRCDHSEVALTNCTLSDCAAEGTGGGIAVIEGSVALTNGTIENCRAGAAGGGVYGDHAEIALTNCDLKNNTGSAGGAVFLTRSEFVSTNDTYENNSIGSVTLFDKSEGVFTNSTLSGGGIVCRASELVITNGTIESGTEAALSCLEHSSAVITNATLKGGKGLDKDETSEVVATNVEY